MRSQEAARRAVGWLAVVFSISAATPACGQTDAPTAVRPGRPFRGLFGGAQVDPSRNKTLDLSLVLLGGYDQNATIAASSGGGGGTTDPRFGQSSGVASASASLLFQRRRNESENSFFAGARTGLRYYPSLTNLNAADYGAASGFTVRASNRVHLSGTGDAAYQPFFSLLAIPAFPGAGMPPTTGDFGFAERPSLIYGASVDTTFDVSRRTHAVAGYLFRALDLIGASDEGRLRQHNIRAGIRRDVTRRVAVEGGYNFDDSNGAYTGPGTMTRSQGGEFTVEYRRTLRSRRTVNIGLSAGYTSIDTRGVVSRSDEQVTASLRFSADLGRSWNASGDYRRGMRRLPGIVDPIFSNDVQVRAAGLVGRRVDVTLTGLYSKGATNASDWRGYDSASGTAQIRWAVNRTAALRADYIYYRYEFPFAAGIPTGFDRGISRHAVRLGMDFWLPLNR